VQQIPPESKGTISVLGDDDSRTPQVKMKRLAVVQQYILATNPVIGGNRLLPAEPGPVFDNIPGIWRDGTGLLQVYGGKSHTRRVCTLYQSTGASGACEGAERKHERGVLP